MLAASSGFVAIASAAKTERRLLRLACFENQRRVDLGAGFGAGLRIGDSGAGALIVRAKPAHEAPLFLRRALRVQRDKPRQNVFVGQVGRPAIGLRHQSVDLVVHFVDDQHKALGLDGLFGGGQRLARSQRQPRPLPWAKREAKN